MQSLEDLAKGLKELEAQQKTKVRKRPTKREILAFLAVEVGYDFYKDCLENEATYKDLVAIHKAVAKKQYRDIIAMTTAMRVAQAEKKDYQKIMKKWQKLSE